jgi:hypothetical protein
MKTTESTNTPSAPHHVPKDDGALDQAAKGAHGVVNRVAGAADEAVRKAIPVIDRAAEYAHRTVDKTVTGVAPAAEWLNEQAAALDATQKKLVGNAREYVAANPLRSLVMALAAGFLLSRILRK